MANMGYDLYICARSSVGLEHMTFNHGVENSNFSGHTNEFVGEYSLKNLHLYGRVGEEGPRLLWEQDITASSSGVASTIWSVNSGGLSPAC